MYKNSQLLPIDQVQPGSVHNLYVPRLQECGWVVSVWTAVQFRAVTYLSYSHHSHVNSQQLRHVRLSETKNHRLTRERIVL